MEKLQQDREHTFLLFFERFRILIRKAIARHCHNITLTDIDDIEQEVHLKLWELVQKDRNIRNITSYVYRVAVNASIDAIRQMKARREEDFSESEEEYSFHDDFNGLLHSDTTELLDVLEKSLLTLETQRQLSVRLYLQGYSTEEIAVLQQWTPAKARNLTYRGLADLREALKKRGIEG